MALLQPLGQKLLSNVSVVKLDRRGKHFEIAVLPNKVSSWRAGLETDIDEVVQSHSIFANVDQGMLAKRSDVFEALGVTDMEDGLRIILAEGKLKLAEKERKLRIANMTKEIASIVASQCVNSNTQRPLTASMVERAMKQIGFSVKPTKAEKAQALVLIRRLQEAKYPITRARIRLKFITKPEFEERMVAMLPIVESVERKEDMSVIIAQVDPGKLRPLAKELADEIGEDVGIDILELNVTLTNTGDAQEDTAAPNVEIEEPAANAETDEAAPNVETDETAKPDQ